MKVEEGCLTTTSQLRYISKVILIVDDETDLVSQMKDRLVSMIKEFMREDTVLTK